MKGAQNIRFGLNVRLAAILAAVLNWPGRLVKLSLMTSNFGGLKRCALALFLTGRVSATCNRGIILALQVIADNVTEHLRRRRIVLVLQVAGYDVAVYGRVRPVVLRLQIAGYDVAVHGHGCRVVLNSEIVRDCVAHRAGGSRIVLYGEITADLIGGARGCVIPNQHWSSVVLELQIAAHSCAAYLALHRALRNILDHQATANSGGRADRETASDLPALAGGWGRRNRWPGRRARRSRGRAGGARGRRGGRPTNLAGPRPRRDISNLQVATNR